MYEMMKAYFSQKKRCKLLDDRLQAGLSEDERTFLEAAEVGDGDVVKSMLESGKVKVDCSDQQGRTALEMAVTGNDVDTVLYLLERSSAKHIHRALLAAADNDMERICELILDHPHYKESVRRETQRQAAEMTGGDTSFFEESASDNRFSHVNLSNLLLEVLLRAAKRNQFQVVKKIMMCGVFLEEPHDYFCACEACTEGRREDFKVYTTRRLDTYTALASPAYISLTQEDPFMAAFNLSRKFRQLSEVEGEYKGIYQQLDHQVQKFTLNLLDMCQSSDEVKSVLNGRPKSSSDSGNGKGDSSESESYVSDNKILPLVYTAVRLEQKKFIAHPQCQAQIGQMWYSGVPMLRYLNRFAYLMCAIPVGVIVCPILSVMYLIAPWSRVTKLVNTPLMKFLNYTCSYLTFLILVITARLYLRPFFDSFSCDHPESIGYFMITIILMCIIGWIFEECKQIYGCGFRNYVASWWNVLDSFMLSFLLASFVLMVTVPVKLNRAIRYNGVPHTNSSLLNVMMNSKTQESSSPVCDQARRSAEYSFNGFCSKFSAEEFHVVWEPAWVPDPELLSDILFSFGTILSITRFSFIMPANESLGTMLVSVFRVVADILKIMGMFLLILIAFTCGLAGLFAPARCLTDSFDGFSGTLSTLTWSFFGMGSMTAPYLKENNENASVQSLTNNPDKAQGASSIAVYLYGIYVFLTMIVMLNLLIAVMSNSFQEVQDERDVEWKFARTELWLTFVEPGTPVYPPFNIIPSIQHVWEAFVFVIKQTKFKYLLPHDGKRVRYVAVQTGSDCELDELFENPDTEGFHTRQDVLCFLVRRYVQDCERKKIEGEDGQNASGEEQMRRLIEKTSSKLEKRIGELSCRMAVLEKDINYIKEEEDETNALQKEHFENFTTFSMRKGSENDRYEALLDEAKLQIMARLDSERIQMERVLDHKTNSMLRKVEDSTLTLATQVDKIQTLSKTPYK